MKTKITSLRYKIIFLILVISGVLSSCQKREQNNPFDPECPKEIWTPTNFQATLEGNTVKLTWSQLVNNISGFKLTRKVDSGTDSSLPRQAKEANQLTDNTLIGGKVHIYSLVAYAGNNESNTITCQITPTLPATITTSSPTFITTTTVISGGTITTDSGAIISERGVCWATTTAPTIASSKLIIGTGTGSFSNTVTGLLPATLYYFRAYAINGQGTAYGNEVNFRTTTGSHNL